MAWAGAWATCSSLLLVACDPNVLIGAVTAGGDGGGGGAFATGGSGGSVLFFEAHHEVDLSEWTAEGPETGYLYCPDEQASITTKRAHSGAGSVQISIDTADGANPICQMLHRTPAPEAYYGAWFFIEQDHEAIEGWWTILFFKTKTTSHWDLGFYHDGYTSFGLYDHDEDRSTFAPAMPVLPIGRWFHLEAYLAYAEGKPTDIELWLDGTTLLRRTAGEAPRDLFWGLGNEGSGLSPSNSTLYIDDVTISSRRLGP